jgi:hypothetical protein
LAPYNGFDAKSKVNWSAGTSQAGNSSRCDNCRAWPESVLPDV